nr:hypothetical protein [Tanacetum cinerariifolium]
SIDENEVATLKLVMSEIFGEENFRNTFTIRRYDKNLNRQFIEQGLSTFNTGFEYVLCYSKSPDFTFNPVYKASSETRQNFGYWKGFWNDADRPTMRYQLLGYKPETGQWKWKQETGIAAAKNYEEYQKSFADKMTLEEYWESTGKKLQFIRRNPNGKGMNKGVEHWIPPTSGILRNTNWTDIFASKSEPETQGYFDYPKNIDLIKEFIRLGEGSESDIILDFFAGSGSTAHATLAYNQEQGKNHKFLCVQYAEKLAETSEAFEAGLRTIADITRLRLKAVVANKKTKAAGDLY